MWFHLGLNPLECIRCNIRHIHHRMKHLLSSSGYLLDEFLHKSKNRNVPFHSATPTTTTIDATSNWIKSKILNALTTHCAYAYCDLLWLVTRNSYEYIRRERVQNGRTDRQTATNWIRFFFFFVSSFESLVPFVLHVWRQNKLVGTDIKKQCFRNVAGAGVLIRTWRRHGKNLHFHAERRKHPSTWNSLIHLIWHSLKIKSSDTWAASAIHFAHSSSCLSIWLDSGHMLRIVDPLRL